MLALDLHFEVEDVALLHIFFVLDLEQAVASAGGSGQRAGTILLAGSRLRSADLCVKRDLDVGKVLKENIDVDMLLFGQPAQHLW